MTLAYNLSQLANFVNSSGQLDAATGLTNTSAISFPSGTLMLFQQSTAPTGWTKQTTYNNRTLRVVSGSVSSGGSLSFTSFAAQTTVGNTTLSTSQIPNHSHTIPANVAGIYYRDDPPQPGFRQESASVESYGTGGGASHNHSINLDIQYVDLIIAARN